MNPFGETALTTKPKETPGVLADVSVQREIAEVQSMIILAKKFPRNPMEAMDKILIACQRPGLAESALYSYARGGTEITGPSIRLAEAIAQNWQNIQFGVRELEQRNGESTVESYAWDLENNSRQTKVFQVRHERHTKKGSYRLEDPRDIYENVANNAARRLRACILGIVPGDVVEAAVNQCEATLKAKADTSSEALKKMVDAFGQYGVTKTQIEKRIQRKLESITAAQVISLRKIYNSLKDAMSSPSDWFPVDEPTTGSEEHLKGTEAAKEALRRPRRTKVEMELAKQQAETERLAAMQPDPPPEPSYANGKVMCPATGDRVDRQYCTKEMGCPDDPGTCEALKI